MSMFFSFSSQTETTWERPSSTPGTPKMSQRHKNCLPAGTAALSLFPSKFSVTTASLRISSMGLGIHQKFHSGTKQSFMHTKHIVSVTNFICSLNGGTETSSVFLWALKTCRGTIKVFYSVKFQNVGGSPDISFFHCKFPCFFPWLWERNKNYKDNIHHHSTAVTAGSNILHICLATNPLQRLLRLLQC